MQRCEVCFAAMRNLITSLAPLLLLAHMGCDAAEKGRAEAKREAEADDKQKAASIKPIDKIKTPVPQGTHLKCNQVIDPTAFQGALEETDALTVRDSTGGFLDSTVSCTLIRGGERPDAKAQAKIIKDTGRLGTIPGDPVCIITMYCWVIDSEDKLRERCKSGPNSLLSPDDGTTGGFACKRTLPQGEFDIDSFKFVDNDTKCMFEVSGGPSVTDNDKIATCARVARESIGPEHIAPGAADRYSDAPPADPAAGSGSAAPAPTP
jgi:hypothetical protein